MTSIDHRRIRELKPEELMGPLNDVESKHAPCVLYVMGRVELAQEQPRVSIVGARRATPEGLKRAGKLARILARQGITVVSGLASGIDTAAHLAAIEENGHTIAIIGTPLDRTYPAANAALQRTIADSHLLVSQFPIGSAVQRKNFILRNRTMALLSNATVIVEAGESSGSLSQAWEAVRLGRPLFLLQSLLARTDLHWPARLLAEGARPLSDAKDLIAALPTTRLDRCEDAPF